MYNTHGIIPKHFDMNNMADQKLMEKLKEQINLEGEVQFLDIDDTFNFTCNHCGMCCISKNVALHPHQLYAAAKDLDMTAKDFINKYCYSDIMPSSGAPILLVKRNDINMCMLAKVDVKNGGTGFTCSLSRSARPHSCRDFPIGTATSMDENGNISMNFFKVDTDCKNPGGDEHIVGEYLQDLFDEKEEQAVSIRILKTIVDDKNYANIRDIMFASHMFKQMYDITRDAPTDELKEKEEATNMVKVLALPYEMFYKSLIDIMYNVDLDRPFVDQEQEIIDKINDLKEKVTDHCQNVIEHFTNVVGVDIKTLRESGAETIMDVIDYCRENNIYPDSIMNRAMGTNNIKHPKKDDDRNSLRD